MAIPVAIRSSGSRAATALLNAGMLSPTPSPVSTAEGKNTPK
jgi:hypothetical protein